MNHVFGHCMGRRFTCEIPIDAPAGAGKMTKVVQTTLEEEEYKTLREVLKRKRLSLKEGLRLAVTRLLQDEVKLDRSDPFLSRKPVGRSGRKNLSRAHDKYLYGKG
jgi:hypothetical protein